MPGGLFAEWGTQPREREGEENKEKERQSESDTHTTHKLGQLVKRPEPERFLFSADATTSDDRDETSAETGRGSTRGGVA